jgi:hypothetical protein
LDASNRPELLSRFWRSLFAANLASFVQALRTPISKKRNKHIRQVLVEATRLIPCYCQKLALLYGRERQRGYSIRHFRRQRYLWFATGGDLVSLDPSKLPQTTALTGEELKLQERASFETAVNGISLSM